jgi:hypothetical protein
VQAFGTFDCSRDWEPLEVVTEDSHPVLRQHIDAHGDLIFTGACRDVSAVVGQLWAAHHQVSQGWIPFERYLNRMATFDQILGGGHGKLASGPLFLLDAYAEVLRSSGCSISPFLEHPPRVWESGAWRPQSNRLSMLRVGHSFIAAETFSLLTVAAQRGLQQT